ncbi:5-aminoimidazole-4-carboxamide ribonucleotide transformylase [Longispora fulva]|uniref:Phosphoribosylaminoimidazolecarboxamide formyltransferase/IMP cyclohydrolase n=1 Tax=Longispora fulva TaxID=619741 RepID=A0A8J7KNE6_9ACTN|nr:phosphoribosylaminoimidazolecarboxamide formyltransferase [Longispora fulva]MBG6135162.1 phosphoribosylaminoimidazolecarboxamide formyltransferase/IMP cyclohydrolase [Longispora fulva]GIG56603.1 5-aminoimidazole-4-carboxamide ribonucleotide transformylase [Longispora fulva]
MDLRYGTNPHQAATVTPVQPGRWPVRVLNGTPSAINLLDALNGWQLVSEAARTLGRPAAASFKHVSPAGAAMAGPVDEVTSGLYGLDRVGAVTSAYVRARDADPKSSYGDLAAVSHPVDTELADLLSRVVCDGVIAPGYEPGTVATLAGKKNGRFLVLQADPAFTAPVLESREVFGLRFTEERDSVPLTTALDLSSSAAGDLLLGLIVLRYTQSNSVCYLRDGATLGIGAGQQSRVDCTRLAGAKADTWWLRRHPAVRGLDFRPGVRRQDRINWQIRYLEGGLTPDEDARLAAALATPAPEFAAGDRRAWLAARRGVAFVSDGALPFRDNVDHAHRHGVDHIAEPGGSARSAEVEDACREHGITLTRTGIRLFHH